MGGRCHFAVHATVIYLAELAFRQLNPVGLEPVARPRVERAVNGEQRQAPQQAGTSLPAARRVSIYCHKSRGSDIFVRRDG